MATANAAFNTEGLYTNTIRFEVRNETSVRLGIRKTVAKDADWCCFDNFSLRYLSPATAIHSIVGDNALNAENRHTAYDISGHAIPVSEASNGIFILDGKKCAVRAH